METGGSAGGWSADQAAASLSEIAYLERATAHILAGWLPKISDMALKAALAQVMHRAGERGSALRRRLQGLERAGRTEPRACGGWRRVMRRIDAAAGPEPLLGALEAVVWPGLAALYRRHQDATDPLGDGPSRQLVGQALPEVEALLAGAMRGGAPSGVGAAGFAREVQSLWEARGKGPELAWSEALWAPLDRVPRAARPPGLERCAPGSLGLLTVDSVHEPEDVGRFLHADLDEEYTTLELTARNSYEHPDMPERFHLDMARQSADEARHALLVTRLLETRGWRYGDFAVSTSSYDGLYQFAPCEAGSRRELLWRLLIRQTFMEGLALDSLAHDVSRRAAAGQHDIAEAFDYLLRDEVFHAGSGLRWSAYLLGGDRRAVLQARYEALTCYTTRAEAERGRFVEANLEKAMGELATITQGRRRRGGRPPERPLNRADRVRAGFSDDDILQVVSWGYATE